MAATVSGSKTFTVDLSPTHTAAKLTTVCAIAPENLNYGQLIFLLHCCSLKAGAEEYPFLVGSLTT